MSVPVIITQPKSADYWTGKTPVPLFVVATAEEGVLSYRWYRNGILISGATSASYTPSTAQIGEYDYHCNVTCRVGTVSETVSSDIAIIMVRNYDPSLALITDRTQADVDRVTELNKKGFANMTAAERTEYLTNLKGAYNASDLNRVGEAVEYVADRLNNIGGFNIRYTAKQDWTVNDIPTPAQMEAYIADIAAIRAAYQTAAPHAPSDAELLTYEEANDIEKILIAADDMLKRVAKIFVYSGTVYSGMIWEDFTNV